jgi:quinol monooxygenase YgiN
MKRIVARFFIKNDSIDAFKCLAAELVEETRKEEGCLFYSLFEDAACPGEFLFYEEYQNQAAVDLHIGSAYFQVFSKGSAEMQSKKPVIDII